MDRKQLQQLARERAADAETLPAARRWSGAYDLAGYAVECALKACIARLTRKSDFPDKDFAQRCHTHKIEVLVEAAGRKELRKADAADDPEFSMKWSVVAKWDEKARYRRWAMDDAIELCRAVSDETSGVLPWIERYW